MGYLFGGVQDVKDDDEELEGNFFNDLYTVSIENEKATWSEVELCGKRLPGNEGERKRRRRKKDENGDGEEDGEDDDEEDEEDEVEGKMGELGLKVDAAAEKTVTV